MAVGDLAMPEMHPVVGVRAGVVEAGIRYRERRDLVLFELASDATVAGVFTQSGFAAAPVQLCRRYLQQAGIRYWLINTGNANAGTGELGLQNALRSCQAVAAQTGVQPEQVLPFSTGVIGEHLPVDRIEAALPAAIAALQADNWVAAASGIMTTDTRPKGASVRFTHEGREYTITGISKGAGMIRPNMATMLAFVATDAAVSRELLQQLLADAVAQSFNRITIDGDTSTNDSCVLVATGAAGNAALTSSQDALYALLREQLCAVFARLAQLIVRDGEGATKFITVRVEGGANSRECCDVAYAVAHSPLIKTAFFASDPNWGRIVAAVGYAGVDGLEQNRVRVWLDDVCIVDKGGRAPDYTEAQGAAVMQQPEITIRIDLGRGVACDTVWTCDLSYDYVRINADYRS